jgi:hypothetical protein
MDVEEILGCSDEVYANIMEPLLGWVGASASNAEFLLSLLTGFLLISYFLGKDFTRTQAILVVVPYSVIYLVLSHGYYLDQSATYGSVQLLGLVCTKVPIGDPIVPFEWQALAMVSMYWALYLVSLYFMWTIRHPKTERPL